MKRAIVLCLVLCAGGPLAADPADAGAKFRELSAAFKEVKKSAQWEEIKRRRDIVVALGDLDHPGVVPLLHEVFTSDREPVCRIPALTGLGKRGDFGVLKSVVTVIMRERDELYRMALPLLFAHARDDRIGPWLVRNLLPEKRDAVLRASVVESLGLLRCAEALPAIRGMAGGEGADLRIRYEAILALGRIGGMPAFDELVPFLSSPERYLREAAVLALAETGSPAAPEKVLPLAMDPAPLVQEAVAGVLLAAKAEAGLPALVEMLRSGRLRVMDAARAALEGITGEKLGLDPGAWEKWLADRKAGAPAPAADPASSVATYYGMRVFSDRVLFVVDVSGSMKAGEPERIATAREELKKVLSMLNPKTLMNIVAFSGTPRWWREAEVEAGPASIAAAKEFADRLEAGGGTNVYDTLEQAFTLNREIDTIYFLGDGSPSLGTYTEQEEILARVRSLNRMRKIRIHCIALLRGEVGRFGGRMGPGLGRGRSISDERAYDEEEAARFLARLASEHGGSFLRVD